MNGIEELTYEQALDRLKKTVEKLENGAVSLDESVKLYEEGTRLAVYCQKKLENAKQKIAGIAAYTGDENDG